MSITATVLIPTHDHGPTLHYAIRSVLNQTVQGFELFVIGDGVPPEARTIIQDYLHKDSRIRFFDHPKGPRHGEIYRHQALLEARGDIVCYLSDDDMWLPSHLEYMQELLRNSDYAHVLPLVILPSGDVFLYSGTLSRSESWESIRLGRNFIPLSAAGHTLSFYRSLPYGWRTTPEGIPTDLYMWQQMLNVNGCKARTGMRATVLNFPSPARKEWTIQERLNELKEWEKKLSDEQTLILLAYEFLIWQKLQSEMEWRIGKAVLSLPVLGPVLRRIASAVLSRGSR